MRRWIVEGRVSSDAFVWREGWTDWQLASRVFPEFATAAASEEDSVSVKPAGKMAIPDSISKTVAYNRRKRRQTTFGILLLLFGTLVVVALVVVLVIVLNRGT